MSKELAIHEAFKRGDLDALKMALGDLPDFPNYDNPLSIGNVALLKNEWVNLQLHLLSNGEEFPFLPFVRGGVRWGRVMETVDKWPTIND